MSSHGFSTKAHIYMYIYIWENKFEGGNNENNRMHLSNRYHPLNINNETSQSDFLYGLLFCNIYIYIYRVTRRLYIYIYSLK